VTTRFLLLPISGSSAIERSPQDMMQVMRSSRGSCVHGRLSLNPIRGGGQTSRIAARNQEEDIAIVMAGIETDGLQKLRSGPC
jgi:hypothetical protein